MELSINRTDTACTVHIQFPLIAKNFTFNFVEFSDKIVRLSTVSSYGTLLFMTPVGQSYSCQKEISVVLSDQNVPTMKGYVLLRAFTVQPFIFKNNEFGPGKIIRIY